MKMNKIGIIGAGVMGTGVAQAFAQYGFKVNLIDISKEALEKAKANISRNIRFQVLLGKNKELLGMDETINNIEFSQDYNSLNDVDVVIENVVENWEVKKGVYEKIRDICKEGCLFLVNTSCISISKIASLTNCADKVIGTHFMNPVPLKNTIEVIRGVYTSEETINQTEELLKSIGKKIVVVNDFPGFVSNRISHLLMNEAAFVVQDNVASPEEVDEIFRDCYEHKMGPLETADLIGLDTVVNSLDVLYESYKDPKFRCCPLLRKMVDANQLGRKTGKGFYEYYN
ncbi:MAG: 3-hydroxyacyl-CoA dehydrogenase family protein [Clostridium sp.]|nr:3-hydroxyacyl-CoA dehydrogenase family protein [Clostridium sp.]